MAYYDHRHSGIDRTNILPVVKAVEGETITMKPTFLMPNCVFNKYIVFTDNVESVTTPCDGIIHITTPKYVIV